MPTNIDQKTIATIARALADRQVHDLVGTDAIIAHVATLPRDRQVLVEVQSVDTSDLHRYNGGVDVRATVAGTPVLAVFELQDPGMHQPILHSRLASEGPTPRETLPRHLDDA